MKRLLLTLWRSTAGRYIRRHPRYWVVVPVALFLGVVFAWIGWHELQHICTFVAVEGVLHRAWSAFVAGVND